jgi:hypothetical protein
VGKGAVLIDQFVLSFFHFDVNAGQDLRLYRYSLLLLLASEGAAVKLPKMMCQHQCHDQNAEAQDNHTLRLP